jgi:hypothetical protein
MNAKLAKKKNLRQETTVSNEIELLIAQYVPDNIYRAIEEQLKVCSELEKKYLVQRVLTSSDLKNFPAYCKMGYKAGNKINENPPIPTEPDNAFELLKNFYARLEFEKQKVLIIFRAGSLKEPVIKAEIKVIEDFITEAEKLNYHECFSAPIRYGYYTMLNETSEHYEYLRLKNGFYEDTAITPEQFSVHSTPAKVYGRYFLFYEYMKEQLSNYLPQQQIGTEQIGDNATKSGTKAEPTNRTKILKLYYEKERQKVNDSMVISLEVQNLKSLKNIRDQMESTNYQPTTNPKNKKAYKSSYDYLIDIFERDNNHIALKLVKEDLENLNKAISK